MRAARTDINAETDIDRQVAAPTVPFTPLDLGVSLKAWWNADDHGTANMTDDGAGLISSWKDRINNIAVTATLSKRPTWASNSFNSSYAALTFDGVDDQLDTTTFTLLPTGSIAGEMWGLASQNEPAGSFNTLVAYGGSATGRWLGRQLSTLSRARGSDETVNYIDTVVAFDGNVIIGCRWSGTTLSGRVNGQNFNPATAAIATLNTASTGFFRIGGRSVGSGSLWWKGPVRHILVTLTLTTLQQQQLEGWLAWDVGLASLLPAGHPYKAAAPTITRAWQPRDLGTALKAWWSADDHGTGLMVDDGAGLISSWTDRIAGLSLTGATTARPTWTTTAFNTSFAGVTFNGTANVLQAASTAGLVTGTTGGESWLAVNNLRLGSSAGTSVMAAYGTLNSNQTRGLMRASVSSVNRAQVTEWVNNLTDTLVDFSGSHIVAGAWGGGLEAGFINGSAFSPASAASAAFNTTTVATMLGGATTVTLLSNIAVRHWFVTTTLTTLQRQQLQGWIAWDSGLTAKLPAGHPYKLAPP